MSRTMDTVRGHLGVSAGPRFETFGRTIRIEAEGSMEPGGGALVTPGQARELALELLERCLVTVDVQGDDLLDAALRVIKGWPVFG